MLVCAVLKTVWRQVLPSGESIESMTVDGLYAITVSGSGRLVRVWSIAEGTLWYEHSTHERSKERANKPAAAGAARAEWSTSDAVMVGSRLAVLNGNVVVAIHEHEQAWKYAVRSGLVARRLVGAGSDKLHVICTSESESDSITITTLSMKTGESTSDKSVTAPFTLTAQAVTIVDSTYLVLIAPSASEARVIRITDGSGQTTDLKSLLSAEQQMDVVAGSIPAPAPLGGGVKSLFTLSSKRNKSVFKIASDLSVKSVQSFDVKQRADSIALSAGVDPKTQNSFIIKTTVRGAANGQSLSVDTISIESGATQSLVKSMDVSGRGGVSRAFAAVVPPISGGSGSGSGSDSKKWWGVLVVCHDASVLMLYGDGEVAWIREESLAAIKQVEFIELPIEHAFNQHSFPSLAERIVPQAKLLLV